MQGYWKDGRYILASTLEDKLDKAQAEIDRLKAIIETLVDLSLWCGIISRGEACRCLGVDRCDLDDWLAEREKKKELIGALREKLSIIADQVEYGLANEECSIGCLQAIKKAMEVGE